MADSSSSSVYNEAAPLSSNFLYSGTYSNNLNFAQTANSFSFFTPDASGQTTQSTYKNQIACVPDINKELVKTGPLVSGRSAPWGSSNSLLNSSTSKTKSYKYCVDASSSRYMTVCPNKLPITTSGFGSAAMSSVDWYLYPKFCSTATNTDVAVNPINIGATTVSLPFNKFISMSTLSYGNANTSSFTFETSSKQTMQTVSVQNKKLTDAVVDLKMYLCASTTGEGSALNNPYGVRLTVRNSTNVEHVNLSNKIFCINSNILPAATNPFSSIPQATLVKGYSSINPGIINLSPGQFLDITLMKIIASPYPNTINASDSSVLFIDLDNLLYTAPTLELTSNKNSYTYTDTLNFSCNITPTNINNDNINGQKLQLEIYKQGVVLPVSSLDGTVVDGNATFSTSNRSIYKNGNYTAVVKYNASDASNNSPSSFYPDNRSHYINSQSNTLSFTIVKKPIILDYDLSQLLSEYSILNLYSFNKFTMRDASDNYIPGTLIFNIWEYASSEWKKLGNPITVTSINGVPDLNVQVNPKNIGMKITSTYKFNYTFSPSDTDIISYTKPIDEGYVIQTETPILTQTLYNSNNIIVENPTVSYTENTTVSCVLKDKTNNIYEFSTVSGTIIANINNDSISLQLSYDSNSKTYKNIFSPKSLNLLRYNLTNYTITSSFTVVPTNQKISSVNNSLFTFNGVEFISNIENLNPNIYDTVRINSVIKDKFNAQTYSINDIQGQVVFNVRNLTNSFNTTTITSQTNDLKYTYSFVPVDLLINYSNNSLQIDSQFVFSDSQIASISKINSFNISLITPILSITPKSEINDYHYGQEFNVTLTGIANKNDTGTLYLYGKSTNNREVSKLENVTLNGNYKFENIDIDDLVEDDVLSTLQANQDVNGRIKWVPTNVNAYNHIEDSFKITLSKTVTNFNNILIGNNQCSFVDTINVTGKIVSDYSEQISGVVKMYKNNDLNTVIGQSNISTDANLNNLFSIDVSSNEVTSYNFTLIFTPTYNNVYLATVSDNISNFIEFRKVDITPIIKIYDLNTSLTSNSNSTNIVYTHNFKIGVENMNQLNNTSLVVSIGDNYTSSPIIITNGNVLTDTINYVSLNKNAVIPIVISDSKNILLNFVDYNSNNLLKSLYNITPPNPNITFIKDAMVPRINSIQFRSLATNNVSTSLNFEEEFKIIGSFNLIRDENANIIPITGVLNLYVGSTANVPKILNTNLTISNSEQIIVNSFKSSDYDIVSGHKQFIFEFVPNDVNINNIFSGQLDYTITASTISDVTLNLFPLNGLEQTFYKESFEGTLSLFDIGAVGTVNVYCVNPENALDLQLLSSVILLTSSETKNTQVEYSFICDPITFDLASDTGIYNIVVKYKSSNLAKYEDNTMESINQYSISKMPVKLSELYIDNTNYDSFINNYERNVGDSLSITGKIQTLNNTYIDGGKVEIITFVSQSDDGNYYNIIDNSIPLSNGIRDPITHTDYVNVNSNGEFSCSILLTNNSSLYLNSNSVFQIIYRNDKNYSTNYFSYENTIPGIYQIVIDNKDISPSDFKFRLDKSVLTNSYNFPYHEDMLHFTLELNEYYSVLSSPESNTIISISLFDKNTGLKVGNNSYPLNIVPLTKTIAGQTKTICFAELFINPKTENISYNSSSTYSAVCSFSSSGYNSFSEFVTDSTENFIVFNIEPTRITIDIELYSSETGLATSSLNYEENVNIQIKVSPYYTIQPGVNQNKNIMGSIELRNQTNGYNTNGALMNLRKHDGTMTNVITFDSISESTGSYTNGIIVNYSPKNNSDLNISNVSKIFTIFEPSSTGYVNVSNKYAVGAASPTMYITKYTPTLETLNINVINDILHSDTSNNKVDDKYVYYDNSNNVIYNGVINFDEEFTVECSLNRNIAGTVRYYYSDSASQNAIFTEIIPKTSMVTGLQTQTNNRFISTFDSKLIPIPVNHIYYLKTIFTPATQLLSFYNSDDSSLLYFNVYQSNKFGVGKISWDTENNAIITKTKSFTDSQTITINVSFDFDADVITSHKKCEVTFYHTDYEHESNKFFNPIYLDLSTTSNTRHVSTSFTIPASTFKFKPEAYSIRALFKPVLANNTRNDNFPVVIEINPLTLIIKPFITSSITNFRYQYSDQISLNLTLNAGSGITDITPYSKLVFNISNFNASTTTYSKTYEQTFTGTNISFPNFNEIINTNSVNLQPGRYVLEIYATNNTNSSIIKTEVFNTLFDIDKKQVSLTLTFDKYNLSYRSQNRVYINIGNFPINVGEVHIAFTNAKDMWQVANKYIRSSELVQDSSYNYICDIPDISTWVVAGVYKITAALDNMYYSGSQSENPNARLLVTKESNCEIVLNNTTFDVASDSNITINSLVKYNNSVNINDGQLGLSINNSVVSNVGYNFVVSSALLNKDINNLVLKFTSNNYIAKSLPFIVNVTKKTTNNLQPVLNYNALENTISTFKLHLTNYNNSDTVTFYKLTSITKLNPTVSSSGVYTFNLSDLVYGNNTLYAVIRSSLYDIQTNEIVVVRNKSDVTVELDSPVFNLSYKANSLIDIRYRVTKNNNINEIISNNGVIEFHKLVYEDNASDINHDEIIGYSTVINNVASILQYKLVGNSKVDATDKFYDNKIKFYAKFINSVDYNEFQTSNSSLVIVTTKDNARIIDDNSFSSNYKLGDTISLEYIVVKPSSSLDATDVNIKAKINAEQSAIENLEITNRTKAINQTNYDLADASFNRANTEYYTSESNLTTAINNKNSAYSHLLAAQNSVDVAKNNLDMVTIDKVEAELAFRTMQEVSKLYSLGTNINSENIALAETNYNTALVNYNSKLAVYNGILSEISSNKNIVTQNEILVQTKQSNRDSALLNVTSKETDLNIAQSAYEQSIVAHETALQNVKNIQKQIIEISNYISEIEEDYENKQADYNPKLNDYNTKRDAFMLVEPSLLEAKQNSESSYNIANVAYINNHSVAELNVQTKTQELTNVTNTYNDISANLAIQTGKSFTLNDLTNMWAVIDQQSTSSTPQNPFFVVYTIKDNETANASWYKSKQFYGSNVGAEISGPMFLYTGEDPTTIHPEITNRVKLDLNSGLSAGLQNSNEIVKALSIQTSSNLVGTSVNDYNFIFREFGTIGTITNANLSFTPTSTNNIVNIYADGVKGIDTENGWLFNNNSLKSNGTMPKINWYLEYNSSEELTQSLTSTESSKITSQNSLQTAQDELNLLVSNRDTTYIAFQTATQNYNVAKQPVDNAHAILQLSFASYNPVKINYETSMSNKITKETQLVLLENVELDSLSRIAPLKITVDTSSTNVVNSKSEYQTKLQEYTVAKQNYDTSVYSLQTSNNKLTILTNGITIVQDVNNLLDVKNAKYVIWKSYVKYVQIQNISTNITINSIIAEATREVSLLYDAKYALLKTALADVTNKTQLYNLSSTAYSNATNSKNIAYDKYVTAYNVRMNALSAYWTYYYNIWEPSVTASNTAANNARDILNPIAITSGSVIFYKTVVNNNVPMVQILGKITPNERGLAKLSYKLVDIGTVKFHAKISDLPDYYDASTLDSSINVIQRNDTIINNNSVFDSELYKTGDSVSLNYSVVKNDVNSTPITDGTIAIYKKVGSIEQLLDSYEINNMNNGIIWHNHILTDAGVVKFYAKYIYSTNNQDKVGFEQSINVISKLNSSIEILSILSEPYKLGNTVNISHKLTSTNIYNVNNILMSRTTNIEEGIVEIHKVVGGLDEVISYLTLTSGSNGIISFNYDLIDTGLVGFYASYKGSKNYHESTNFTNMRTISVLDKYTASVTNITEMPRTESKKLGDLITLKYNVSYNNLPVTEGKFEITKTIMVNNVEFKQILGYANVNSNGQAIFTYNLVDVDCQILLDGKFINSINYKELPSALNFSNVINVYSKYSSKIIRTSILKDTNLNYKLGDLLVLEYKVTNNDNQISVRDGIISIHKVITGANNVKTDEIIYYSAPNLSTGKVSYTHKIDNLNTTSFYAAFKESYDYYNSHTDPEYINVIKEYGNATNVLTVSNISPKYSDTIMLTSSITDASNIITEGVMEFYVRILGKPIELIGTSNVSNNTASINYIVNDVGSVTFSSIFKNSSNYIDINSNTVSSTVVKTNINSLSISPMSAVQFDIVDVIATINFGREVCYTNLGKIEFTVTNNTKITKTTVDIINNVSTYKLYLANTSNYVVDAKFIGNELFNESSVSTITISPTVNNNYKSVTFTENTFSVVNNYFNIIATVSLNNENVDERFMLINTGFIIFESYENGILQNLKTAIVPLSNGTAESIVRKEQNYTYTVKFVDTIDSPNITLFGTM